MMYIEAMLYLSDKTFMFRQGNRLLVTSFLYFTKTARFNKGFKLKRIRRSHRKQDYCRENEVNLCNEFMDLK